MRVGVLRYYGQALILLFPLFLFCCNRNSDEIPLVPPPTNPLEREFIGYGVVDVSFVHILSGPMQDNDSLGYLRKRSLVRITERRSVNGRGNAESWVKVDAPYPASSDGKIQGWLRESSLNVYDNEVQALTAAQAMTP